MLNLLRSDVYRLVRMFHFWFFVVFTVFVCVAGVAMMAWIASPEFAQTVNESAYEATADSMSEAERAEMQASMQEDMAEHATLNDRVMPSISYTWSNMFLSGGFLGVCGSIVVVVFLASEIKNGFWRNLTMGSRGRMRYFAEKLVFIAAIQAVFTLLSAGATTAGFALFGFTYEQADAPGQLALWLLLAWLLECAYAFIVACVMWLTRSEWMGAICTILVSSGIGGSLAVMALNTLSAALPWLAQVPYLMLNGCSRMLSEGAVWLTTANGSIPALGAFPAAYVALVEVVYIMVFAAVACVACRKRDI